MARLHFSATIGNQLCARCVFPIHHPGPSLPVRLALGAICLLALSACGDGDPVATPSAGTTTTPTPTSTPTPTPRLIGYAGGESPGVEVKDRGDTSMLRTDGFAVGGVNDCGGYAALWVVVDGRWTEAQSTQETWDCAVLRRYAVPSDVAGETCYDYRAQKERKYHQA